MPIARLGAALLACCSLAAANASLASATTLEPPDGRVYSGVSTSGVGANFDAYLRITDQSSVAIYNRFGGKGLTDIKWVLSEFKQRPVVGMLSWHMFAASYNPNIPGGSNQSIARGDIDGYILETAAAIRAYGDPLFLRPNWEMNGHWFNFSTYDKKGNYRAPNSHAHYRDAWRRTVILFEGGSKAQINAKLAALGLPGLTTAASRVPATTNVSWVWCPSHGTQFPEKQSVFDYYPGDRYVDWVGADWYAYGPGDANMVEPKATAKHGPNEIYDRLSGPASSGQKPFMMAEWGVRDADRPTWMADMLGWMAARPQVKAQVYFNVFAHDGNSELQAAPRALQVFRSALSAPKWIRDHRQVVTAKPGIPPAPPPSTNPIPGPTPAPEPEPTPEPDPDVAPAPDPDPAPPPAAGDSAGPSITLMSPAAGQTISGNVAVNPKVSDPSGVKRVTFHLDGVLKDTDTPPKIGWTLDGRTLTPGEHRLEIRATDGEGNTSSVTLPVVGPAQAGGPSITLASPADGSSVAGILKVRPVVKDAAGISRVRFLLDGVVKDTDSPPKVAWDLDTRKLSAGSHVIRIEATNKKGRTSTLSREVRVGQSSAARTGAHADYGLDLTTDARSLTAGFRVEGGATLDLLVNGNSEMSRNIVSAYRWRSDTLRKGRHTVRTVLRDANGSALTTTTLTALIR